MNSVTSGDRRACMQRSTRGAQSLRTGIRYAAARSRAPRHPGAQQATRLDALPDARCAVGGKWGGELLLCLPPRGQDHQVPEGLSTNLLRNRWKYSRRSTGSYSLLWTASIAWPIPE